MPVTTVDIQALTRADSMHMDVIDSSTPLFPEHQSQRGGPCLAGVSGELQVLLPIEGLVDLEALGELLRKDLARAEKEIAGLTGRLANPNFTGKAPPEVVAECRAILAEAEVQAALAYRRLADLG